MISLPHRTSSPSAILPPNLLCLPFIIMLPPNLLYLFFHRFILAFFPSFQFLLLFLHYSLSSFVAISYFFKKYWFFFFFFFFFSFNFGVILPSLCSGTAFFFYWINLVPFAIPSPPSAGFVALHRHRILFL